MLLRRLRAGDTTAFDEIYAAFNGRLFSFLSRMARNRSIAEDLLEETWLRLISGSAGLRQDTRLGPWLFTVARNLYVSHCRSRAREQAYTADVVLLWPVALPHTPFHEVAFREMEEQLEAALELLPPMYREALLLAGVERMPAADAAKVIGISPESLRQRLSRARAQLSRIMSERSAPTRQASRGEP